MLARGSVVAVSAEREGEGWHCGVSLCDCSFDSLRGFIW